MKFSKTKKTLWAFILIGVALVNSSYIFKNNLIIGSWKAQVNYSNTEGTIIAIFRKDNTATISYSFAERKYNFNYAFKNDSVLIFTDIVNGKKIKEYHKIKYLSNSKLSLRPYPSNIVREDISLADTDYSRL